VNSGFQVLPNPVADRLTITYKLMDETDVKLVIYNLNGAIVKTPVRGERQSKGNYNMAVDVSGLKPGSYLISLSLNNYRQTSKICIAK
jgi:hypothetical protein